MRRSASSALLLLVGLAACAPKPQAPSATALDCSQPFEALKAKIVGQAGVRAAPEEPSEPYRAYLMEGGKASYFVTTPGAPAHPAILMQEVAGGGEMRNTGCAYGDKAAYDQLTAYLASLRASRR